MGRQAEIAPTEALVTNPGRDVYQKSVKSDALLYQEGFRSTAETRHGDPGGDARGAGSTDARFTNPNNVLYRNKTGERQIGRFFVARKADG